MSRRELLTLFAARLRQLRQSRQLSREELGARTGLTVGGLWHLENARREPMLSTFILLAAGLKVSLVELVPEEYRMGLLKQQGLESEEE